MLFDIRCEDVRDNQLSDLLQQLNRDVREDIRVLLPQNTEGHRDVMLLQHALIVIANSEFRHAIHLEKICASSVAYVVAQTFRGSVSHACHTSLPYLRRLKRSR